jgi:hypothetical protein
MEYNGSIIVLVFSTPHDNLIVSKCFKRFIEQSMEVKSIEIFSGTQNVTDKLYQIEWYEYSITTRRKSQSLEKTTD